MGNVTMPTPAFLAGGAVCLLAGYVFGTSTGPSTPERTTGTVTSFSLTRGRLCLRGETVAEQEGALPDGRLCGRWRRGPRSVAPIRGDDFRFVSVVPAGARRNEAVIYGAVVR